MEIQLISFGKIAEFLANQQLDIEEINNTNELQLHLEKKFPPLSKLKYKLAINKVVIQQNTIVKNGDQVAIMPPFSGG